MINGKLRPWGKPNWLLGMKSLRGEDWFLIGSISTQDRCLSMLKHQKISFNLAHAAFLEIVDSPTAKFAADTVARREKNKKDWMAQTDVLRRELHTLALLAPVKELKTLVDGWVAKKITKNVILDVSTLPERFLFNVCGNNVIT